MIFQTAGNTAKRVCNYRSANKKTNLSCYFPYWRGRQTKSCETVPSITENHLESLESPIIIA